MRKHINVVAAVMINDNGEVLCALRSPSMALPDLWEFPGGKIELGENHETALRREIMEELHVDIKIGDKIENTYYEYDKFTIQLTSYFYHPCRCLGLSVPANKYICPDIRDKVKAETHIIE